MEAKQRGTVKMKKLSEIVQTLPLSVIAEKYYGAPSIPGTDATAEVNKGNQPKPGDEKKFMHAHKVERHADRNGNGDDVFNATNIKHVGTGGKDNPDPFSPGNDKIAEEQLDEGRKNLPVTDGQPGKHKPSTYKYLGVHKQTGLHVFQEPGGPKELFAKRHPGSGDAGWHIKRGAHVYEFASSLKEEALDEKWSSDYETPKSKRGMWDGYSLADLRKARQSASGKRLERIDFAIRAKQKNKWGKVSEEEQIDELSKCKMTEYGKKAGKEYTQELKKDFSRKKSNRARGILTAAIKIKKTNEEVEQIDEVSSKTKTEKWRAYASGREFGKDYPSKEAAKEATSKYKKNFPKEKYYVRKGTK
jgi:hypothetical protein